MKSYRTMRDVGGILADYYDGDIAAAARKFSQGFHTGRLHFTGYTEPVQPEPPAGVSTLDHFFHL